MQQRGIVYFVGAGPGDPDLLTIKGRRVLREADVVIFDRLVNPILLMETKCDAKLVYCGKQPCQHFLRQEDIHKELLIHARKGKTVVRLKGGDPSVFGRVGEEAEALSKYRIKFEIIPGITAGIAASAYAGATITHREHSRSFAVVSGHSKVSDGKPDVKWEALARGVDTIVFYMGVKHVKTIVEQLQAHGMNTNTKVLVVQWGTYSRQQTVEGSLTSIVNEIEKKQVKNPAIIIVGDVAAMREKLQWYENRHLSGTSIFIPNEEQDHQLPIQEWKRLGADVYCESLSVKEPLTADQLQILIDLSEKDELLFLSGATVTAFLQALYDQEIDRRRMKANVYCVDNGTQKVLKDAGFIGNKITHPKALRSPIVIGSELELVAVGSLNSSRQFVQVSDVVTVRECQMFQGMIDEGHINTIILANLSDALKFANLLKRIRIDSSYIQETSMVICEEQVKEFLSSIGIKPTYTYRGSLGSETLIEFISESTLPVVIES